MSNTTVKPGPVTEAHHLLAMGTLRLNPSCKYRECTGNDNSTKQNQSIQQRERERERERERDLITGNVQEMINTKQNQSIQQRERERERDRDRQRERHTFSGQGEAAHKEKDSYSSDRHFGSRRFVL